MYIIFIQVSFLLRNYYLFIKKVDGVYFIMQLEYIYYEDLFKRIILYFKEVLNI